MSKTKSTTSKKAGEGSSDRFVLDFLYNDSRRIGAFLSQFEPGHLQRFTHTKSADQAQREESEKAGKGSIPGLVEGKISRIEEATSATAQGYERVFDPLWTNARAFLDHLSENDLIQTDITEATMGQFVLVRGSLIISDLQMMRPLWGQPVVKDFIKHNAQAAEDEQTEGLNRQQKRAEQARQRRAKGQPEPPSEADLALAIFPHLPHSGQIHIVTEDYAVWGPAAEGAMVSLMGDLVLKHGPKIAGEWSLLGILDAYPFEADEMMTNMEMIRTGMTVENVARVPLQLAPYVRQALGRPLLSYGVTPLLIYREIAKRRGA